MAKTKTKHAELAGARGIARERRREDDPWFGKRRSAGEMGRQKTKAAHNKKACRGTRRDW